MTSPRERIEQGLEHYEPHEYAKRNVADLRALVAENTRLEAERDEAKAQQERFFIAARKTQSRAELASHQWYTTRWGDGRGGHNWNCSCGVNSWGTGAENPERYKRYESREDAAQAAVVHIISRPVTDTPEGESDDV